MKKLSLSLIIILIISVSCKKSTGPADEDILTKKITDIIPQKYLDTLKILGLTVNSSTTPPNVEGIYIIKPVLLKKSNIPGDVVGMSFLTAKLKLYAQSNADFGIKLLGKNFILVNDTSIVTAISGSGNNFTVYGKIKSVAANGYNSAIFALIISGSIEGGV